MRAQVFRRGSASSLPGGRSCFARSYDAIALRNESYAVSPEPGVPRLSCAFMTAVAARQLVDRGRVQLDSNVDVYLRDLRIRSRYRRPTTVRQLLTHTAALDEIRPGPSPTAKPAFSRCVTISVRGSYSMRRQGAATAYSTYGIAFAGVIADDVSGLPFERYLVEEKAVRSYDVSACVSSALPRRHGEISFLRSLTDPGAQDLIAHPTGGPERFAYRLMVAGPAARGTLETRT